MIKRLRPLLGTFVEVAVANDANNMTEAHMQTAISAAFSCIEKIQQQLGFHNPDSDLTRLNCANGNWITFNPPGINCLKLARALTRISNGAFNCTLGKAIVDYGALPAPASSDPIKIIGNWHDIEIDQRQVRLRQPVWITLDGIAKGFAVDQGVKTLQQFGIQSAWINAGGDIRVYGSIVMPIIIRDHLGKEHSMGGLQNASIATSTSHHSPDFPGLLLNTNTNSMPALAMVANNTWTVIAKSAWRADALTKVAANTPATMRKERIASLGGNWIALN